ncbi:MAG: ligase-associated DNA damage response endonuclease PdeM [Pseudomonadota bacterium]
MYASPAPRLADTTDQDAPDQSANQIHFAGKTFIADRSGALWWEDEKTLLLADLHLEKGSRYAAGGQLIPPYDSGTSLARLATVIETYQPNRVACLGDSFHDKEAGHRLPEAYREVLKDLVKNRDWLWISGNHDPDPPEGLGGTPLVEAEIAGLTLRHQAARPTTPEISGHYHPKASVRVRHKRITGRCFVFDHQRLILPAFGAYTGGLSVRAPELRTLFADSAHVLVIGARRMFAFPLNKLR